MGTYVPPDGVTDINHYTTYVYSTQIRAKRAPFFSRVSAGANANTLLHYKCPDANECIFNLYSSFSLRSILNASGGRACQSAVNCPKTASHSEFTPSLHDGSMVVFKGDVSSPASFLSGFLGALIAHRQAVAYTIEPWYMKTSTGWPFLPEGCICHC